jgi:hypothetical protein
VWSRCFTTILLVVGLLLAAVAASAATKRHTGKPKRPAAPLAAPKLQAPRDEATTDSVPAFTWAPVKGASAYEFQLSADGAFRSSVFASTSGSIRTANTAATITKALASADYYWRVRAVRATGGASHWSAVRTLHVSWSQAPALQAPADGATNNYPAPLVLSWSAVPRAFKYAVQLATDPALGSAAPGFSKPIETSGTDFTVGTALPAGTYYWAVTPLDAEKHSGQRSRIGAFNVDWPSTTATRLTDLDPDAAVFDPQFSWDPVPGAARYQIEVNSSEDFAPDSKVCCTDPTTGTSLSPTQILANNAYYWRVRAVDPDGNAGVWNVGPGFTKDFDGIVPSIPNLRVRNNQHDPLPPATLAEPQYPAIDTNNPIIQWDPVPGASSYEVDISSWNGFACNWTNMHGYRTATPAWSPLAAAPLFPHRLHIGPNNWPTATVDIRGLSYIGPGATYCVRVIAISDRPGSTTNGYISAATQLNGIGKPAFFYDSAPGPDDPPDASTTAPAPFETPASAYLTPQQGSVSPRMPVFTWNDVPGAESYYVVVAKDAGFTNIIDIAFTEAPAYAPRGTNAAITYPEETTHYYWAVVPWNTTQDSTTLPPDNNNPIAFDKRSVPPALLAPIGGADVLTQPTFRWSEARDAQGVPEGARNYRLEVAQDPTFAKPIDDVTTSSTAYTSSSTYPADTLLYWRVRANDESGAQNGGLAWSAPQTFERRLPAPQPSADNPTSGRTIPVLSWTRVEGAIAYDLHVDQPNGTQQDFSTRSTAFAPTVNYGTGEWRWKVRAQFPKATFGSTPGAYSASQPWKRFIGSPAGARGVSNANRILLSWDPVEMGKAYKVEIATTSSFTTPIDSATTDNTSYAPSLANPSFLNGGTLYWRVASLDEGNTLGGWTSGTFSLPKTIKVTLSGNLRRGRKGAVRVKVTDSRGRKVRKAQVRVKGAGVKVPARRTSAKGMTVFKLRPRRAGKLTFQVTRGGFRAGSAVLKVAR